MAKSAIYERRRERKSTDANESMAEQNRLAVCRTWSRSYGALVSRATSFCNGNRDRGEDLVSKATVKILEFVARHEQPLREVGALYALVLRNLAIDEHRSLRRAALIYDEAVDVHSDADSWRLPAGDADAHERLSDDETIAAVETLMAARPNKVRELFVQRFVEDRTYGEIAPALGISEASARKRVQKLRAWIARRVAAEICAGEVTRRPPARH